MRRSLLHTLWGDEPPGKLGISYQEPGGPFLSKRFDSLLDAEKFVQGLSTRYNIYFRIAAVDPDAPPEGRGGAEHSIALPALYAEVDYGPGERFGDETAAVKFIKSLPLKPSAIVASGGGYHLYWILHEYWDLRDPEELKRAGALLKRWGAFVRSEAGGAGVDAVWDLARVLRVPGTMNLKPEYRSPRPVKLVHLNGVRYDPGDFEQCIPEEIVEASNTPAPPLPDKILPGGRHEALVSLAGTLRRRGMDSEIIYTTLCKFNEARCDPPHSDAHVRQIADYVAEHYEAADPVGASNGTARSTPPSVDQAIAALGEAEDANGATEPLRELAAALAGADRLTRQTARDSAIQALKGRVSSPARLVDAALHTEAGEVGDLDAPGQKVEIMDPEPWPDPVDGAELLDDIRSAAERFLVLPEGGSVAVALWSVFTHCINTFGIAPILAFLAPTKRCGKSTARRYVGRIAARPLNVSAVTEATLFRSIEKWQPTLLVDEAENLLRGDTAVREIVNSSHTRDSAQVPRCVGDDNEVRLFSTWAPKCLALIGRMPESAEDRSIILNLRRKMPGEEVERFLLRNPYPELDALQSQAARWAADNREALRSADPEFPNGLNDRAIDNWDALLSIAEVAGGDWPELARDAALTLSGGRQSALDIGEQLLSDIFSVFEEEMVDELPSDALALKLAAMEGRPWPEWGRAKKPITANAVARLLKPFGVSPGRLSSGQKRGYRRAGFEEAWDRYRPPSEDPPSTTVKPSETQSLTGETPDSQPSDGGWLLTVANTRKSLAAEGDLTVGRLNRGGAAKDTPSSDPESVEGPPGEYAEEYF